MTDWTSPMQQTYEFYIVDPITWIDTSKIKTVKKCNIKRDSNTETLGSATIDIAESIGECYVRIYLITIQNGEENKYPLGTFLVQTPSSSYNGKYKEVSMDAYTPLIELKEKHPPLGYSLESGTVNSDPIMSLAHKLTQEHTRAPVIPSSAIGATNSTKLTTNFTADTNDTWLSYITDLIASDNHKFDLDEMGNILFAPIQDTASLQPVWTYNDDNSSILYPEITMNHDLYGIPNVVEVVYSNGGTPYYAKAVNDDPNSPTSTISRGREITHRITDPELAGLVDQNDVQNYADRKLKEFSTIEYTVSYTHGYCPVRIGDCVRLNYTSAGIKDVKAKVISQSINCVPGCPVTEKAVFTTKLWR